MTEQECKEALAASKKEVQANREEVEAWFSGERARANKIIDRAIERNYFTKEDINSGAISDKVNQVMNAIGDSHIGFIASAIAYSYFEGDRVEVDGVNDALVTLAGDIVFSGDFTRDALCLAYGVEDESDPKGGSDCHPTK